MVLTQVMDCLLFYRLLQQLSTSENFIGFAEDTVATGQPVTVNTKGTVDENQRVALTPGNSILYRQMVQ